METRPTSGASIGSVGARWRGPGSCSEGHPVLALRGARVPVGAAADRTRGEHGAVAERAVDQRSGVVELRPFFDAVGALVRVSAGHDEGFADVSGRTIAIAALRVRAVAATRAVDGLFRRPRDVL